MTPVRLTVLADRYPVGSETFVVNEIDQLRRAGHVVQVVGGMRGEGADASLVVATEFGPARRIAALVRLVARHPLRSLADVRARARWAVEDEPRPLRELAPVTLAVSRHASRHLHAHFAAGAALDAMRLSALLGIPWSVTVHAYDLYAVPRNLAEKLRSAAFVTSGCDYTVRDIRAVEPAAAPRVHKVIMGVDGEVFRRSTGYPGGRHVLAVGRLVEKKGFGDLVAAAQIMVARGSAPSRVTIVGDGPLEASLRAQIDAAGLQDVVELAGPLPPAEVRAALEKADVLAMPCVVAADGDRDSMPVVVKEAMAMAVPVVVSDEVGLPELIEPGWGLMHEPGDAQGLASALEQMLALPAQERAAMGERGRAWVLENADVAKETARLSALIAAQQPG